MKQSGNYKKNEKKDLMQHLEMINMITGRRTMAKCLEARAKWKDADNLQISFAPNAKFIYVLRKVEIVS